MQKNVTKKKVLRPLKRLRIMEIAAMPVHPEAARYPLVDKAKLRVIGVSMQEDEQQCPLCVWRGQLFDGRNRLAAAQLVHMEYLLVKYYDDLTEAKVIRRVAALNSIRRNLSIKSKVQLALEDYWAAKRKGEKLTIAAAAKKYGVAERTLNRHKAAHGAAQAVKNGSAEAVVRPRQPTFKLSQVEAALRPAILAVADLRRLKDTDEQTYERLKRQLLRITDEIGSHSALAE